MIVTPIMSKNMNVIVDVLLPLYHQVYKFLFNKKKVCTCIEELEGMTRKKDSKNTLCS